MTVWTFPEHPWPEEKTIRWAGELGDAALVCLVVGGRRRSVAWVEGCPVFSLYDWNTGTTHVLEGWELDEEQQ